MSHKLSFVCPTRNRREWIGEAIQSMLMQSLKDVQVVIVNDASEDDTRRFLDEWASKFKEMKIIHNSKPYGGGVSRNIGMDAADGDIILVMDDDDICIVERAEIALKWFKENKKSELVNFPYCQVGYFNEIIKPFDGIPFDHELFLKNGGITYFANPTVAYKKEAVKKMGGYMAENDKMTDDIQFLKKWVETGHLVDFMPGNYVLLHRVLPDSMMSKLRGFDPNWVKA